MNEIEQNAVTDLHAAYLAEILTGNEQTAPLAAPFMAIHCFPLGFLEKNQQIVCHWNWRTLSKLFESDMGASFVRRNLDVFFYRDDEKKKTHNYLRLMNNGVVEIVFDKFAFADINVNTANITWATRYVLYEISRVMRFYRALKFSFPLTLKTTFVAGENLQSNCYDWFGANDEEYDAAHGKTFFFKTPIVRLHDANFKKYTRHICSPLLPAFDVLWQAASYERCFEYDGRGRFAEKHTHPRYYEPQLK